jgi:hypothetical protein
MTEPAPTGKLCASVPLEVRDHRKTQWYWIDNGVYERYGAQVGLAGLGLYLALAKYVNREEGSCYPSLATLAEKCGSTPKTIAEHLRVLHDKGLIHVDLRPGRSPLITLLPIVNRAPDPDPSKKDQCPCCSLTAKQPQPTEKLEVPVPDAQNVTRVESTEEPSPEPKRELNSLSGSMVQGEGKPAPVMMTETLTVPDPATTSPHAITDETREALCESGLAGIRGILANLSRIDAVRLEMQGCNHPRRDETGTACAVCYEILEPAAAD